MCFSPVSVVKHFIFQDNFKNIFFCDKNEIIMCDTLCDLVPFVQFKKPENLPWRSVTFNKVAG